MLTLRNYRTNNKIKNRYIIPMSYKSKKINRRRNFKKVQSRKRIFGGASQMEDNDLKSVPSNDKASDDIMKKIEEQNKIEIPSIDEIPVVGPVIEKTGDLVEGAAIKGLDVIGNSIGVDIDNPESLGEKLDNIKDALSDPNNVEMAKEILGNAGKFVEVGIEAATPVIEKTVDKILPVFTKEADKAVKAGLGTVVNLAEDIAGPFIGIPRTLLSATEAFNASVNAGSVLVKGTAEAIQGTQENFNRIMDESMPKIPKIPKVPEMPKIPDMPKVPEMRNIDSTVQAGGSLKKYQRQAKMIGGRILKSQSEFLGEQLFSSQNSQQTGGKLQTKRRHYLKRKMTSRSYK